MKVLHKILVAPAVTMAFLLLLGGVAHGVLGQQSAALEEVSRTRVGAYQVAVEAAQDLTVVHSNVYRLITWMSGLKEDVIRKTADQQKERTEKIEARLTFFGSASVATEEERRLVQLATGELAKYRKSVLSAIDLSSGDTLTGATAMQLADKQFQSTLKHFEELVQLEKRLAQESADAAAAAAATAVRLLAGIMLLALLLSGAIAVGMARRIVRPLHVAIASADRIARGDLGEQLRVSGTDETAQLLRSLAAMTDKLRGLVGEVADGARTVADTSAQIAQGNLDLSQRTEEQASTLEETASSMEQLTTTVARNATNARDASQLATTASDVALKGGEVVGQVVSTMTRISDSSRKISDIIGVIDAIAFQTNILALNAAVEAARAGEQGRGFAVVASEVRNLAQRSATAAREIKTLIGTSVDQVEAGSRLVNTAGKTMQDIVAAVRQVTGLIKDIAKASEEQSSGLGQVNSAVAQMDHVVQQNATLVEEAAAATESMKAQAEALLQTVSRFKLGGGAQLASLEPLQPPELPLPSFAAIAGQAAN
jgi:methyl-accepting chemotaxis protein